MEEEGTAPEEAEPEEVEATTAPPPRKSRKLLVVVAIVVVVALVGGVLGYYLLRNQIPTAAFSFSSVDLHLTVNAQNSTDADGDALVMSWNWGDSSAQGTGVVASHDYASAGTYTVVLSVSDSRGGAATAQNAVTIVILPTPFFIARQTGMTTTFDATGSTGSAGSTVSNYSWSFGDGSGGSGITTSHTYASAGRYSATLTVKDSAGLTNSVSHYVSANTTTVDVLGSQFFASGCPYQDYWYLRYNTYGDRIQKNGQFPCFDYYPWVLYTKPALRSQNPSWTYTLWRIDMLATNNFGYNVANPVYLPTFNGSVAPAANSYIDMNLTFNYLNKDANLTDPLNINYWDTTPWPINPSYSDGFGYLVRGNVTMDATEAQRTFDVGIPVAFSPTASPVPQWNNATRAFASDQQYASSSTNGNISEYGSYAIPQTAGAAIQQVQIGVQGYAAGDDQVQLAFSTDAGTTWQVVGNVSFGATESTTYVDVSSLRSWTPSLLSDGSFRTRIQYVQVGGTASPIYVDWVPVRVKSSSAAWWWAASTKFGAPAGAVELKMGNWLDSQGDGPYDIYNGFQYYYSTDITDMNATVATDGTTTIQLFMSGWGYDVLFDRWSYWGETNYSKAVNSPYGAYQPKGWMPFETCWCENATINATIRNSLDMHFRATSEYWFGAVGNPGPDGVLNTSDDLPGWSFAPSLMDYVPPSDSSLPGACCSVHSELKWYENSATTIASPGSWGYGSSFEYMVVPSRWNMSVGNTLTLVMPGFSIPWIDPTKSTWNTITNVTNYVTFNSPLRLNTVEAGGSSATGFWTWDQRSRTFSMAAPSGFAWPDTGLPLNPDPYIEFGPETLG